MIGKKLALGAVIEGEPHRRQRLLLHPTSSPRTSTGGSSSRSTTLLTHWVQ